MPKNTPSPQPLGRAKRNIQSRHQHDSLILNNSEIKHLHAIKPYNDRKSSKTTKRQSSKQRYIISPYELSRSKSKKLQTSIKKQETKMKDIYEELVNLKCQYKNLKSSYSKLVSEKQQICHRQQKQKLSFCREIQEARRQSQQYQKNVGFLEGQIQRIKKECYKIVQGEKFKIKKLEETLQEKDLMIAYLRNTLNTNPNNPTQDPLMFLQSSTPIYYDIFKSNPSSQSSQISNVIIETTPNVTSMRRKYEEDSLSFSRDKSQLESVHSLLSVDHNLTFTKKEGRMHESVVDLMEDQYITISDKQEIKQPQTNLSQKNTIEVTSKNHTNEKIGKLNTKRYQIITDQNKDSNQQQISCQSKKKALNSSGDLVKVKRKNTIKKKK